MNQIEVGQELEFFEAAHAFGRPIDKGTRVRVGFVLDEVSEPKITVVLLGEEPPETMTVPRHVLTMHCVPVTKPA